MVPTPLVKQLSSTSNHVLLQPEGTFGLPDVLEMEEAFNFPHQTPLVSCTTKSRTKASHLGMKYGFIMKRKSEMAMPMEYAVQVCIMPS